MVGMLVTGVACSSQAQKDSNIRVRITREGDGKKETFEREYASVDEMREDDEYRAFAEGDTDFDFHFDTGGMHERIMELHEGDTFSFSFDHDDGPHNEPHKRMQRHRFRGRGGNGFWFGDDDAVIDFRSFDSEEYEEKLKEKMSELEERIKGLDKNLQEEIMESMKEIEEMSSGIFRIKRGGLSIEDVGDDFGSRGKVDRNNTLEVDDMDFMVMNKRLTLRFRVKEEGEVTIKISNESGKDIYSRYFESFGGTFSDNIDFSKYADGKYLLEVSKDKKRLTKKIVID